MRHRLPALRRAPESPWKSVLGAGTPERGTEYGGVRVLCATSVGGHPIARVIDSLVGMGCWMRGADVRYLLCDGALPACEVCQYDVFSTPQEFVRRGPQRRHCNGCFSTGLRYLEPLPVLTHRYGDLLDRGAAERALSEAQEMALEDCFKFAPDGLALGEQVRANALRFFGKADLSSEPEELVLAVAQRYAAGAMVTRVVAERAIERWAPDVITAHHGIYVPQGVIGVVARSLGVRVVNWGPSYRSTTVMFSHDDTYHHTAIDEPTSVWDDRELTHDQEQDLLRYLAERRRGRGDWQWIVPEAALRPTMQERNELVAALSLDTTKPVYGLLTNVLWDAQLYYEGHAFPDMLDWLAVTLEHFSRSGRQLIVRIHPHEIKQGNRQPVEPWIRERFPELPANIKIVSHDSDLNTYALMDLCAAVLIYGTKTGVELTPMGIPVVVAGDAWIRGKGLTVDVSAREEYDELLNRLEEIEPLSEATIRRARRYAYHYFFRRMLPFSSLEASGTIPPALRIASLNDLRRGRDPGLDVAVDGVLAGRPFVFDPLRPSTVDA